MMYPNPRWMAILMMFSICLEAAPATEAQAEPPSLLDIFRQAEQDAPQLARWQANLEAGREAESQSEAKAKLPTVALTANITGNFQQIQQQGPSAALPGSGFFASSGYSLILSQPLFHYDRMIAVDQAGQRVNQSEMELEIARQDLVIRVAERYFGLLAALDNQGFAQTRLDNLGKQRAEFRERLRLGDITMVDASEVEAGYDRAAADAVEAGQQLEDAREALRELTGLDHQALLPLAEDIPLVPPEPRDEQLWVEQAVAQNPRVIAASLMADVTETEIHRQEANHLPTLDLVGGSSYQETGGPFGDYQVNGGSVGLLMNVQLYEGGQTTSRIREASHRHEEARAILRQEQRAIHRQARDAYHGVLTSISRIEWLRQSVQSQKESLRAITAGFEVGSRTALDVVLAENEWFRVNRDYVKARYEYLLNTLRLKRAANMLTLEDLAIIDKWLKRATFSP